MGGVWRTSLGSDAARHHVQVLCADVPTWETAATDPRESLSRCLTLKGSFEEA